MPSVSIAPPTKAQTTTAITLKANCSDIASPFIKNFALALIEPVLIKSVGIAKLDHPLVRDELATTLDFSKKILASV